MASSVHEYAAKNSNQQISHELKTDLDITKTFMIGKEYTGMDLPRLLQQPDKEILQELEFVSQKLIQIWKEMEKFALKYSQVQWTQNEEKLQCRSVSKEKWKEEIFDPCSAKAATVDAKINDETNVFWSMARDVISVTFAEEGDAHQFEFQCIPNNTNTNFMFPICQREAFYFCLKTRTLIKRVTKWKYKQECQWYIIVETMTELHILISFWVQFYNVYK